MAFPAAGRDLPRAGRQCRRRASCRCCCRASDPARRSSPRAEAAPAAGPGGRRARAQSGKPFARLVMGVLAVAVFLRCPERPVVVDLGALDVALRFVGFAAIGVCSRVAGVDPDRLIEVGDGEIVVPLALPNERAVVPTERVLAVDLDGAVVIRQRPVEVALGAVGIAAVVVGAGVIGAEFQRPRVVGDRSVVVALVVVEDAAIVVGNREVMALPAAGTDLPRTGGNAGIDWVALLLQSFWSSLNPAAAGAIPAANANRTETNDSERSMRPS